MKRFALSLSILVFFAVGCGLFDVDSTKVHEKAVKLGKVAEIVIDLLSPAPGENTEALDKISENTGKDLSTIVKLGIEIIGLLRREGTQIVPPEIAGEDALLLTRMINVGADTVEVLANGDTRALPFDPLVREAVEKYREGVK